MTGTTMTDRVLKRICVYCGSSNRVDERWRVMARGVAKTLAERGIDVVYGGGSVGLMGEVADAALAAGANVIGVIPDKLRALELGHDGLSELVVTETMHERKMAMAERADAFIALPGGWGTLEEIFEVTTWTQLEYHRKPVGLLNAHGYYDHLVAFLGHAADEGFIRPEHRDLLRVATDPGALIDDLVTCELPALDDRVLRAGRTLP
jgi:uncharacterized protein (TIGR00730 family)